MTTDRSSSRASAGKGQAGTKGSAPGNLRYALQLSRQSSPRLFALMIALPVVEGLLAVVMLLLVKFGTADFLDGTQRASYAIRQFLPWIFAVVAVAIVTVVLDNVRHLIQELQVDHLRRFSARRMHEAIGSLELLEFDEPKVHDRISRAEATADFRPRQVVRGVSGFLASIFRIVALAALLLLLEPLLLPMMAVAGGLILVVSQRLAGERFAYFTTVTPLERKRRYVGWLLTARQPAAEVRSFGLNDYLSSRYDELCRDRHQELRVMVRREWRNMMLGQATFGAVLVASVAILGWLYGSGRMDVATLLTAVIALATLAGAIGSLGGPMAELGEASLFLGDQRAFYAQLARRSGGAPTSVSDNTVAAEPDAVAPASQVAKGDSVGPLRQLSVRNLSFRYPNADQLALHDVSLTVPGGRVVAFVGPNGSGKTTLAKILAFLYAPTSGVVLWNGQETAAMDQEALRDKVTTVFQDHMTYHFSIAENVAFGDIARAADVEAIRSAVEAAGAIETVQMLPEGLQTRLGPEFDNGVSLSGGELQRLAIARSFFRTRDLVVLDEPTSALDAKADYALLRDLRAMLTGRTAIIVSHRFSNVRDADEIYVFNDGRIVERGTHDELMAAHGMYAEMYSLQAAPYLDSPTGS